MDVDKLLKSKNLCSFIYRFLPYVGYVTIIMTENPIIKYALIGALGLLAITSKD
ncbi:putative peptidase S26B [Helianthus annuus]|uniref:Peptidase S26B n=1 Tax=Helianthus annuus TaxID=4232 RepID=A0A9K3DM50_HELAN|nr:putative peptidase S26B [Helianthus annuus]